MFVLGLVLGKPYMEGLGPDLEGVHPLEATLMSACIVVVILS